MEGFKVLAFDFGASSGRAMLGIFDGDKISLVETHRFPNDPVEVNGILYWDILRLFHEIKTGIIKTVNLGHSDIKSIGIDTWGVDFGFLDKNGNLLSNPLHYRNERNDAMLKKAEEIIGRDYIFEKTGIQFLPFNTIYQLLHYKLNESEVFDMADKLLLIPDLLNYFLTGVKTTEYTIASTTQLLNAFSKDWDLDLVNKVAPRRIFTDIVKPGTVVGELKEELKEEFKLENLPVIAVASHDTASAVAAAPVLSDEDYIYISCGTWSLMGTEILEPITDNQNFTNEGGIGTIRYLKNITGLWLIQECNRYWKNEGLNVSFASLEEEARSAKPFKYFIDPDYPEFSYPGNMPSKIQNFCKVTNQEVPVTRGEIIRCIAEGLAFKYRMVMENLEKSLSKDTKIIHLIGGGIKDKLVCQFTANSCGKEVIAGPVEATATGNIILQLIALGKIDNLKDARAIIKNSIKTDVYMPEDRELWEENYLKFKKLLFKQ